MLLAVLPLLVGALPAAAESLPELLKPVDPAVEAELMAKTNFDFRQQRYTAKRFRIVDIDWALLEQEGARFTITPFEGPQLAELAVTVRTMTTARDIQGQRREWVGEVEDSGKLESRSNGEMVQVADYQFAMWIDSGPQEVTLKAARKMAAQTGELVQFFAPYPVTPDVIDAPHVAFKVNLRTVRGRWMAAPGVVIRLGPITDDPRYHFVSWIDRDKVPAGTEYLGPDDQRKQRARMEFEEQLQRERREAAPTNP